MMNWLYVVPRALWKSFFVLNFLAGLIVLYPLFYILLSREYWFPKALALKRFWAKWILAVPGIRVSLWKEPGALNLPSPVVYCANHTSYLDIVVCYRILPGYFVFMAKQELLRAPLFNIFFKRMNISVDRKSKMDSHRAFIKAAQEIDKGHSVFLFPEGTISKDAQLRPFKNGAFKLAIDKQIPIVPVVFLNNWHLLQNGGFFKANGKPGISRVLIHPPIETKGMTEDDLVSLRAKVYDTIAASLAENENR